jgi:hypothetical protein
VAGDQDDALSSVGLKELVHGIYRAQTTEKGLFTGSTRRSTPCLAHQEKSGGTGAAGRGCSFSKIEVYATGAQ